MDLFNDLNDCWWHVKEFQRSMIINTMVCLMQEKLSRLFEHDLKIYFGVDVEVMGTVLNSSSNCKQISHIK